MEMPVSCDSLFHKLCYWQNLLSSKSLKVFLGLCSAYLVI